jgi:hypothetical protein
MLGLVLRPQTGAVENRIGGAQSDGVWSGDSLK